MAASGRRASSSTSGAPRLSARCAARATSPSQPSSKRQLEADAEVGVDGRIETAALLQLRSGEQAAEHEDAEALVAVAVARRRRAAWVSSQPAAGLAPAAGDAAGVAVGTGHCGSGGAIHVPSQTRSPYRR